MYGMQFLSGLPLWKCPYPVRGATFWPCHQHASFYDESSPSSFIFLTVPPFLLTILQLRFDLHAGSWQRSDLQDVRVVRTLGCRQGSGSGYSVRIALLHGCARTPFAVGKDGAAMGGR